MKLKYGIVSDGISTRLETSITNFDKSKGWMQRVLYPDYQKTQIRRFETRGSSEGFPWKSPLNPMYKAWKKIRYAKYPYAGKRMGIATGDLFRSVVGKNQVMPGGTGDDKHRKLISKTRFRAASVLEYAPHFAEERPIFIFSDRTTKRWIKSLKDYLMDKPKGKKKKRKKKPK